MDAAAGPRSNVAAVREAVHPKVLIIGGGINGVGTFRELALQGVDVTLVERGDYASGASSASSHMIHGGIRYLENGEFRLVREAVYERNGLLKIAPHYVKPLETTIPIFRTFSGIVHAPMRFLTHKQTSTVERGAILIKLGLMIYDSFSRDGGTVPRHRFHGRRKSLEQLPQLNKDVKYTATYFDASVHEPERLALDVLGDALSTGPHARAANYLEAVSVHDGAVRLRDMVTGDEFEIVPDLIINTSGPWTDLTNEALGEQTRYMGGTKGSHIVLHHPALLAACAGRELFFENSDGRIVLIYPLRGKVMVGTTDLDADIREPIRCTEEEIDYFIDLVGHVFPDIKIDRSQIVYRFSGVRPLPRHEDTQPGFVSRDYRIVPSKPRGLNGKTVLSLVGGKWTTFRAVAEHLANEALAHIGWQRTVSTYGMAIGGGKDYPRSDSARYEWIVAHAGVLPAPRVARLLARYGTKATDVIAYLEQQGDDALEGTDEFSAQEVRHMAEAEQVVRLQDVLLRRSSSAFDGLATAQVIDEVARVLAGALQWDEARLRTEVADCRQVMTEVHGVQLEPSGLLSSDGGPTASAPRSGRR
ncbi:glycerol-3-phosphate dehydrogenase/oxidase [Microbacterium sp.]|uniref:glycerol-3-phosphate dehydrogenase/oxidase n=1 Tax=Microbacterium sp. TaxID=51671 RepID=UPI003A95CA56